MQNPICISTGCLYKLLEDRNEMVKELRKFSPAGIELSFAYPEYLLNFDLDKDNLEYLRSLKFNSIHAPWENITYGENGKWGQLYFSLMSPFSYSNLHFS
jgi:hypothetical protein